MKKSAKIFAGTVLGFIGLILLCVLIFVGIYFTRFQSLASVEKESNYSDEYDLYTMNIEYDYDLDAIIDYGLDTDQGLFDAVIKESLPLLPVSIKAPSFACTAFKLKTVDNDVLMGRNYDFKKNTSAMLVYCAPKGYYRSVAFAALDNISANNLQDGFKKKIATLVTPFICLDGMNEKGVSIAVLVVDSDPVNQSTGKEKICTTIAIRLVLDRAATTEEAVELLRNYDMRASSGKDYHFYINDASGDGRVVEWDCESEMRELVATPVDVVTNFYTIYEEKVLPNQRNGIYGHGKERYDSVLEVFNQQSENPTVLTAWDALKSVAQESVGETLTSNTQWSIVYNNTDLTAEIVLRRNWDDLYRYDLTNNTLTGPIEEIK